MNVVMFGDDQFCRYTVLFIVGRYLIKSLFSQSNETTPFACLRISMALNEFYARQ